MYKCESCGVTVGPKISKSANSRVTAVRNKTYSNGEKTTTGVEIVKVTSFCPTEAKFWDEVHLTDESHFGPTS